MKAIHAAYHRNLPFAWLKLNVVCRDESEEMHSKIVENRRSF